MRQVERLLIAAALALFAARNLPWNLDDFDQAKQAYVAFEMLETGDAWFQHTPRGAVATKPPLAGWLSAGLRAIGLPWDIAWRLPSFLAAAAFLLILRREGRLLLPSLPAAGAMLAVGAFALNGLTPRLATLVRTDMLLGLSIFLIGWIGWRKLRDGSPWRAADRWAVAAVALAGMLTKGPVIAAFLFPGYAAYALVRRRAGWAASPWPGWWPWLLPLALFAAWGTAGALAHPAFYEQVVMKEFLGRFQSGEGAVHRSQPFYFYLHLFYRAAPWTLLLAALPAADPAVRAAFRRRPDLAWLACWAAAAFLFMSAVPSKRFDRIFPILPPLALLLAGMAGECRRFSPATLRRTTLAALAAAALGTGAYAAAEMAGAFRGDSGALARFGRAAQAEAGRRRQPLLLVEGRDEGMPLYTGVLRFTDDGDAAKAWAAGTTDLVALPERRHEKLAHKFEGATLILSSDPSRDRDQRERWRLIGRP